MTEEKDNVVPIEETKAEQPPLPKPDEIDFNDPGYQRGMITAHHVVKRLMMQIIGDVNAVAVFVQKGGAYLMDDVDISALGSLTQTIGVCLENAYHARNVAIKAEPGDAP